MWNKVEEKLPKDGQVVFIRHKKGNIINHDGSSDHYDCCTFYQGKHIPNVPWRFCDTGFGNNEVPYAWKNGAMQYFGQEITHWMPIPLIGDDEDGTMRDSDKKVMGKVIGKYADAIKNLGER